MKAAKLNKLYLLASVFTGVNLLVSASLAQDLINVVGTLNITDCTSASCINVSTPALLTLGPAPHFLNNEGERLIIITDPLNDLDLISISDSRPSGQFNIMLDIDDITNGTSTRTIVKTDVGVMSFNENINENISLDSVPEDLTVQSLIEPDLFDTNGSNQTYSQIVSSPNSIPDSWITQFPETGGLLIISASDAPRKNIYTMGIAFFIKIPSNPANPTPTSKALRDDNYTTTATFTLTTI